MNVIEKGEMIVKEIADNIDGEIISAVVWGSDIHGELKESMDCNLVIVFDKIDGKKMETVGKIIKKSGGPCIEVPLLVEMGEIEGMMDSVPVSFLNILMSYQTIYGRSLFKGLSSLNHEHLRAQTEQSLRENLFHARRRLYKGFSNKAHMIKEIEMMRGLLKRSIQLYCILKKPWLVTDEEKWSAFFEDFESGDIYLKKYHNSDLSSLSEDELIKTGFSIIDHGIKPLLTFVDEIGP
jgi:hypothetical protein